MLYSCTCACGDIQTPFTTFVDMQTGKSRTRNHLQVSNVIVEGWRPPIPPGSPKPISNMIASCWANNAQERPSFAVLSSLLQTISREKAEVETPQHANTPSIARRFAIQMLGGGGSRPWALQKRGGEQKPGGASTWALYRRPLEGTTSLTEMKICFNVPTDVRSAFKYCWDLGDFTGHVLEECNAEELILCRLLSSPIIGFSDRIFAWRQWGRAINDNVAFNIMHTTPKALQLLNDSDVLKGKSAVKGCLNLGGFAFERINDHACQVTYMVCADLKGNIPFWAINKASEQQALEIYTTYTKQLGYYIRETKGGFARRNSLIIKNEDHVSRFLAEENVSTEGTSQFNYISTNAALPKSRAVVPVARAQSMPSRRSDDRS